MAPVIYLSDGFLANSSEPWRIPDPEDLPSLTVDHPTGPQNGRFLPFLRDPETLARPWALPGTPGLEHRIGGLEKEPETGNVSYDPQHHWRMVQERAEKIARLAEVIPEVEVYGPEEGDLLLVGWGSTYGAIREAVRQAQDEGKSVAHVHLRYLNPFPRNLEEVLRRYRGILVPELNMGQLAQLLRARFASDQTVRWCPGCGDYAILATVQKTFARFGWPREKFVIISGIGCSSRFPYYMNVYGFHTIHGRAPTVATGVKLANPDLSVWVVTGDGDGF